MSGQAVIIERVVLDIAGKIDRGVAFGATSKPDFVRELFLAIVSSRIRWEVACDIVGVILADAQDGNDEKERQGLRIYSDRTLRTAVRRHRHPRRVEGWVQALLANDQEKLRTARAIALSDSPAPEKRRALIPLVPGLGPKQASLLLRNLGEGERLAVLDRHVLRFMSLVGIVPTMPLIGSIRHYERLENAFVAYADYRRVPADTLDLSVWIVMRQLKREDRNWT